MNRALFVAIALSAGVTSAFTPLAAQRRTVARLGQPGSAFKKPAVAVRKLAVAKAAPGLSPTMVLPAGPAIVSAAWVLMSYVFMPLGPTATFAGMTPGQIRWGERAFMNMNEQAPMFFAALWLHAAYVSSAAATQLGALYLIGRALYPVIWATKGGESGPPFPFLFNFTFPQYGILIYMSLTTILKAGFGISLAKYFAMVKLPVFIGNLIGVAIITKFYLWFGPGFEMGLQPGFSKYFKAPAETPSE